MKRYLPLMGLLLAVAVIAIGVLTRSDNPDLLSFRVEGERAYGTGFTDDRSERVIDRLVRDHPEVTTLVLSDMPGTANVIANDRLARRIRAAGLNTHLESDSRIASGAVDLFIAGVERTMECGARIGVHAWGSEIGFDAQDVSMDRLRGFKRGFLKDMGIRPEFYDYTRAAAPSAGLHIMRADEINEWGLTSAPLDCEQTG